MSLPSLHLSLRNDKVDECDGEDDVDWDGDGKNEDDEDDDGDDNVEGDGGNDVGGSLFKGAS